MLFDRYPRQPLIQCDLESRALPAAGKMVNEASFYATIRAGIRGSQYPNIVILQTRRRLSARARTDAGQRELYRGPQEAVGKWRYRPSPAGRGASKRWFNTWKAVVQTLPAVSPNTAVPRASALGGTLVRWQSASKSSMTRDNHATDN